ncbi:HlyD family type I secretion periplasmic adaptor subunit [Roseibium denhamense]|uniref:Membrane fusion protein (MFP) family protein n=1 Tax=Roseibium denhamense TaxID=76305 RepID=A0ABY1PFM2_9HYPH|nr:HlyD family type I secretion periplasmic adaptor subunit [Roseibium denhamense]MTI06208.1 HlyD family type I secretion periplasmic adaptor subunit [Roseibium denhamense]SMP32542.1 HlyD family secretion protein [Roseibium denhamense]
MSEQTSNSADQMLRKTVRNHLLFALFVVVFIVGGIGLWATVTEIAGAVVSSGTVVVESNVKQVQHREGGIVKNIQVKNGDTVAAGDLLIALDDTVTRANLAVITKQLTELTAQELRLEAERDNLSEIIWPDGRTVGDIELGQQLLLEARRNSTDGRKNQLEEQIRQFNKQTEGLEAQVTAKDSEIELIAEELADLDNLLSKQLVPKSRVTALRRETARLRGEYGDLIAQIARTKEAISERRIQILQIEESYRAEVLEQLQEVRSRIAQLEEQKIAAEDELTRVEIVAPRDGYVHQLSVHTIGGVIAPGETVMSIVPREDQLIVEAQVRPVDIDQMAPGQAARVRFPSFDQRTTPELNATLLTVSADLTEDERTGMSFYTARLVIDDAELGKLGQQALVPGMPVETFLQTGDRTVLSYLVKPITDQIAHAMRER